jgi:FkbM family methyltransferase
MKWLIALLGMAEGLLRKMKSKLQRRSDEQTRELERWYREDPHGLKRSEFDFLTASSVVVDLGGYEGQWSSDIYARYQCTLYIFEPVAEFAAKIQHRFRQNTSVNVFAVGLAPNDGTAMIVKDHFASRITDNPGTISKEAEAIQLRSFNDFLATSGIGYIDLIKINIEGAEFSLLEHLIATGTINQIGCLLIQFHIFAENATARRQQIRLALGKTHTLQFDYTFIWECWKIKA